MKTYITKMIADIEKFSFAQMTSNSNGKTSSSGTMGTLICAAGTLCFMLGAVDRAFITKTADIMIQSIIFVGIGATLLGYRKSKADYTELTEEQPTPSTEDKAEDKPLNS